ncbi:formimidoylglutamate deiminase [Nocardioides marinus]|uniref:Formiminoglutamate deiminase n=1 Tax=Nocardioides marinus TaxID=374514 RepID=A0A7Y9YGJ5_9ACTN|nr:formiminoglutamate deiminase [Nocardioides marinus]
MSAYWLERAWVDGAVLDAVLVEVAGGRFTHVAPGVAAAEVPRATRLDGLTLPGLANAHSHAFHRALRGRTQRERGTFWTWREQMYDVAGRLTPDSYRELAAATFREMLAAGYTSVGEFHYLHHQPDGRPHDEPNAMRDALRDAAETAGIRLVLLDAAYLSSGFGAPPQGVQVRYSDGSAAAWAARAGSGPAAIHSVRAVPRDELHHFRGRHPLHVHLSEQVAENDACLAAYGLTPTGLLHAEGLLGPGTTVVHATHLTDEDVELLGSTRTNVCLTPTTERDLADGIGPARRLADAGCRISVGSDSHAVVDPLEELRGLEMHERLATQARGHFTATELLDIATAHDVLGLGDVGRIEVGARADLVTLDTTSPRTAGTGADEHTAVFAATAADVTHVVVDGRVVHRHGDEPAVGGALAGTIGRIWS